MPISLQTQSSSLKRPRSTSNPPSPSSSPKRAASESSEPAESSSGLLGHNMDMTNGTGRASSPLRDMDGSNSGEWVKRTENVHLNEVEEAGNARYKQLYDEFLGAIPPPFVPYGTYYIIPRTFKADLEALALNAQETKTDASPTDLQLDLTPLVESVEGEEVLVINTVLSSEGSYVLDISAKKQRFWTLKDGLSEDDDFLFVNGDGWNKILECLDNYSGPVLPRFCLPGETIQLKPPFFSLYVVEPAHKEQTSTEALSSTKPLKITCPTKTILSTLIKLIRRVVSGQMGSTYNTDCMRYWQLDLLNPPSGSSTLPALDSLLMQHTLLPSLAGSQIVLTQATGRQTIEEFGLTSGDGLVVEIGKIGPLDREIWSVDVNKDGKAVEKGALVMPPVPTAPPPLFSKPAMYEGNASDASSSRMATRSQSKQRDKRGQGLVGLTNLGNTCFMNSAVQCLSNTRELSEYFLSGVYTDELNVDNPLGMHGLIAKAFGMTVEALWTSTGQPFSPRVLKQQTSRFAQQFAGYGQHDTQEFIAFLLDGLHEDLNRIIKKPYIEKPDWKAGGGDRQLAELGKECWSGYKKRNDSVIVDLFQGQLQSTLVCPECSKESITLDPFMYLTVPLPIAQYRRFKSIFVPNDPSEPPIKVHVLIPQNASFQQVKERIGSILKVNPLHLVGFDLWKHTNYAWFYDTDHNSECKDNDDCIFYDVGVPVTASKRGVGSSATDGSITVPVFTYKVVDPKQVPGECSLQPFFITLTKAEAADPSAVREAIMKGYQRYVRESVKAEMYVQSGSSSAAVPPLADEEDEEGEESTTETSTMEIDSPKSATASVSRLSPGSILRRGGSSTSLSSLKSVRSTKTSEMVPRGDLFKVHVADASASDGKDGVLKNMFKSKDTAIQPFFKGSPSQAAEKFSPLENRMKIKKGMFGRITSMMSSSNIESETETDSSPSSPNAPQPVIRPGEGIFVEWTVKKFNEYFDTTVQPEVVDDPAIEIEIKKKKEGKVIGIEDCLDEFSKEETLGQDDLWYCPVCKKHQAATKKLEIYKAPDILVICIKRFGSSRRLSDKLDNMVNFPIEGLDLEERVGERRIAKSMQLNDEECRQYDIEPSSEPLVYDLYAVDNHFGGLGGGHYTAFCKNKTDGQWYNYDDSRVSPATEKSVQSRAAYLLFYRRRAVRPIGGKSREKAQEASRAASPVPSTSSESTFDTNSERRPRNNDLSSDEDSPPKYAGGLPTPPESPVSGSSGSDRGVYGDADDSDRPSVDLDSVGQDLGFGNTAWSSPARPSDTTTLANAPVLAGPAHEVRPEGAVMGNTGSTESAKDVETVDAMTEGKPALQEVE